MKNKIIAWWSGGITSAVACKLAIDLYGKDNVRIIFIDTCNEHPDTYRFFMDCENLYGIDIEIITGIKDYNCRLKGYKDVFNKRHQYFQPNKNTHFHSIQDVWDYHNSLNVGTGAICSTELKRKVREKWQKVNVWEYQVFGFEFDKKEINRALGMAINHPKVKPIFPLLMMAYNKEKCFEIFKEFNIDFPESYKLGYNNNNCQNSMCVQGGVGYWQKIYRDDNEKFLAMAKKEHELTNKAGHQVTMCKDQSEEAEHLLNKKDALLFLLPHPDYPQNKTIMDVKGREPKPIIDCNGFCGLNDLIKRNSTEKEINYQAVIDFG